MRTVLCKDGVGSPLELISTPGGLLVAVDFNSPLKDGAMPGCVVWGLLEVAMANAAIHARFTTRQPASNPGKQPPSRCPSHLAHLAQVRALPGYEAQFGHDVQAGRAYCEASVSRLQRCGWAGVVGGGERKGLRVSGLKPADVSRRCRRQNLTAAAQVHFGSALGAARHPQVPPAAVGAGGAEPCGGCGHCQRGSALPMDLGCHGGVHGQVRRRRVGAGSGSHCASFCTLMTWLGSPAAMPFLLLPAGTTSSAKQMRSCWLRWRRSRRSWTA
jgi:hypothetical protein